MKIIKCCVINTSFNEDIGKAVKHKYILIHGINPIAFPQEVFYCSLVIMQHHCYFVGTAK